MDQMRLWDQVVGAGWVRHAEFIERQSLPFADAAMDGLGSLDGLSVLDVGCGVGSSSLALARRGATAVVGVDLSATMIDEARARLGVEPGLPVTYEVADATTLDPSGRYDAVFSRFGVMFFEDAVAGFTALHELTQPRGQLAFSAWTDPFANPWMMVPVMASFDVLGPPELPAPGEPGPFSLGTDERVREVLTAAGWQDIEVQLVELTRPFDAGGAEATADVVIETNPVLALGLEAAPDAREALRAAVAAALEPHEVDGEVVLASSALVVTATA